MNSFWDKILKVDKNLQIEHDIRYKNQRIYELRSVCGSCDLWMTSECKREITMKVSCNMPICNDFKQKIYVTDLINKLKLEVQDCAG